jgi:hypothetical protein
MIATFASSLSIIVAVFACAVIGYFAPILGPFLIIFLFGLTITLQAFSTATVAEVLENSRRAMKRIVVGEEGAWLRRAPWIGLLCGGVLRSGHDLILGLGAT